MFVGQEEEEEEEERERERERERGKEKKLKLFPHARGGNQASERYSTDDASARFYPIFDYL